MQSVFLILIRWIVIYPMDSAIRRLNNRGQEVGGPQVGDVTYLIGVTRLSLIWLSLHDRWGEHARDKMRENFFSALKASIWCKNKAGGPLPGICHWSVSLYSCNLYLTFTVSSYILLYQSTYRFHLFFLYFFSPFPPSEKPLLSDYSMTDCTES